MESSTSQEKVEANEQPKLEEGVKSEETQKNLALEQIKSLNSFFASLNAFYMTMAISQASQPLVKEESNLIFILIKFNVFNSKKTRGNPTHYEQRNNEESCQKYSYFSMIFYIFLIDNYYSHLKMIMISKYFSQQGKEKKIGSYTLEERMEKIIKFKIKQYKHKQKFPTMRNFKGRSQVAKVKQRARGRFVKTSAASSE